MWQRAVDRQYNLFGTILIFLVTTLTVIGTIIVGSQYSLSAFEKTIFSIASSALFVSVCGLLKMTSIERSVAFQADPPKSSNQKLQEQENIWRKIVYIMTTVTLLLIICLVNLIIWRS